MSLYIFTLDLVSRTYPAITKVDVSLTVCPMIAYLLSHAHQHWVELLI